MTILFKVALIGGAVCAFAFVLRRIRKSEVKIADSTFWFLFAVSLVLLALFPQIAFFFSDLLAIESPANFVFLYVIAALVIREFNSTVELSQLRSKLAALAQEQVLREAQARECEGGELCRGASDDR
ncbi:DUF2304 domain-containing protein [Eggerthella lenta]|uniref:DUF2304 domain-containing protein n=1 Tax=Eggerthella lenta TaxID=84112 RepID=A0A5C5BU23_EGGLN|nr:DUF2304 domain-containing protein [Eggerthella lenta]TNU89960.1 DUF2304 domain-containing protein [Eggerthella lenta]